MKISALFTPADQTEPVPHGGELARILRMICESASEPLQGEPFGPMLVKVPYSHICQARKLLAENSK